MHGLPESLDGGVAVAMADVDEALDLADAHNVTTIPHFVLLKDGIQVCVKRMTFFVVDRGVRS